MTVRGNRTRERHMELPERMDWQEHQLHHRRLHEVRRPLVRRSSDHLGRSGRPVEARGEAAIPDQTLGAYQSPICGVGDSASGRVPTCR